MKSKLLPEKAITALYRKDYKTLNRLVTKDTVNLTDEGGLTLLMLAALETDADARMVEFLIDRGADVHLAGGREHYTALHFAARDLRKDILPVLLAAGADANAQDGNGWTPLHHVV